MTNPIPDPDSARPYKIITDFARWFAKSTKINEINDFEKLLTSFGVKIKLISLSEWQANKFNFLEIEGNKQIKVNICRDFDDNLKKVFYTQALGHYMLHSEEGKKKFILKNLGDKSIYSQEGLCFSLGVLMPDEVFIPIANRDNEELSRLFRVPQDIVKIKKTFLSKEKLIP